MCFGWDAELTLKVDGRVLGALVDGPTRNPLTQTGLELGCEVAN